jgi:copper chaperone NosL
MRTTTLHALALLGTLSLGQLFAGCSAAERPPEIRLDRTACARCGMLVSELAGAAVYRTASGEVRAYDDLGCLLGDLADGVGHDVAPAAIWVHDHDTDTPLRASEAAFVRSPALRTPMGGGLVAFADVAAATAFASGSGGEVLRWADLRAQGSPAQDLEGVR